VAATASATPLARESKGPFTQDELFFILFFTFSHSPHFFAIFFPAPIFTLKQHNTTLMLSDGLCGFRVKNAQKGGVAKKEGGWRKCAKQ
jgi:hypothetical protein